MTHSNDNDDVVFDRLADGELSAVERERLLASLDDRSDGWRRCALAFLEAQSWRLQMQQLVAAPTEQPSVELASAVRDVAARKSIFWPALAAGLLLAFSAGWLVRSPGPGRDVNSQLAESTIEENISPEDLAKNLGPDDVVTLLVRDAEGQPQRLRVPLVDSAGLDNRLGPYTQPVIASPLPNEISHQ